MISSIGSIGSLDNIRPVVPIWEQDVAPKKVGNTDFDNFMAKAMDMYKETSSLEHEANRLQEAFALGENEDMQGIMIAQEKAYTSLQFTMQVTNKMVEAYRELMRLQV